MTDMKKRKTTGSATDLGEQMAKAVRIRENTRHVLFPDRDPRSFDIAAYAYTFSFCDTREKERAYRAMVAAWAWGTGNGRAARRVEPAAGNHKDTEP